MELKELSALAVDSPHYRNLTNHLASSKVIQLEGMAVSAKGFFLAQLRRDSKKPIVILSYNDEHAARLASDLIAYGMGETEVSLLPSTFETLFTTEGAPDYAITGKRLAVLRQIAFGQAPIVVGTASAFLQRIIPANEIAERVFTASVGESVPVGDIETLLVRFGYERVESVEQPGQWTRRGGIVDIFPCSAKLPVRFDFFGDEIESIRVFDTESQRSTESLDRLELLPAREMPIDNRERVEKTLNKLRHELPKKIERLRTENLEMRGEDHASRLEERIEGDIASLSSHTYFDQAEVYLDWIYPEDQCALDIIARDALIVIDEPHQLKARWDESEREMREIAETRRARGEWLHDDLPTVSSFDKLTKLLERHEHPIVLFSLLARPLSWLNIDRDIAANIPAMETFGGRGNALAESLDSWMGNRLRCIFVTKQAARVREQLAQARIAVAPNSRLKVGSQDAGPFVLEGEIAGGFRMPDAGLMVLADVDLYGTPAQPKKKRSSTTDGMRIASYLELREGDYVVHINHGIGVYRGITKLKGTDGAERDYLLLEYADRDRVYVQTDQVDRVQRYIGKDAHAPTINRLNSGEWQRATRAAKKQVQEMAAELIKLYAARHAARRPPCPPDSPWQQEMEQDFAYEETPDQLKAVKAIKKDLERDTPMDRLVCGDVGFGKTEVAMRAAFKVASSGKQVAVLCPTTILAQQHLNTFRSRLAAYPVRVEMMSRFVSKANADETLKGLANGTVDIVVGTHKLLGKTVKFDNLGLLIVDEEQRFGVTHKERIKQLKKSVDVITLTATPIPRTLHMALSGIRDLSLINDPPEGRQPIMTYVREYDDELAREVLLRELDRGGQIYYVSNRVESIDHTAGHIQTLVPHARIGVGHGQMHADDLEEVMLGFYNREFDILVCTTIVESGLDVPNVNTIVVDNADKMGLAQLYQLRGRVGRSDRQGYAYLLYRKDKSLSEVAEKRLGTLREFTDLGSGYKVALRDLEIRGAGNLLGHAQSGTVSAVGFDLYTQLLSQAINELKGEPVEPEFQLPPVTLPLDAHIPTRYIPSEAERILIYKKLTAARSKGDVDDVQAELEDRYGDPPRALWNVLALLRLRLRCKEVGVGSINTEKTRVVIRFSGTHLPTESIRTLARSFLQYEFMPDRVTVGLADTPSKSLRTVEEMVEILAKALPDKSQEARVGVSTGLAPKAISRPGRSTSGFRR